jgi:hypothetical protein
MVRELQNLVNLNAGDTTPLVFWEHPFSEEGHIEYIPGPFMGPKFNPGSCHNIGMRRESPTCLLLGRNLMQWKACVAEDAGFDPDVLDPKNGITSFSFCLVERDGYLFSSVQSLKTDICVYFL